MSFRKAFFTTAIVLQVVLTVGLVVTLLDQAIRTPSAVVPSSQYAGCSHSGTRSGSPACALTTCCSA
ncbi:hypothetical protein BV25DRAFT_1827420 [Artomyces pyxidatus]|uniref:Uncharacterized protein n=1 Tax=Artomyces pyxidatus TaxID=48021 RepID=A0ACB8SYS3_9AGAM|nr:hypothetical protein BV25DRAFT_1827420 [Artomyces pyxidatus]